MKLARHFAIESLNSAALVKAYLKVLTVEDVRTLNNWTTSADTSIDILLKLQTKVKNIEPVENLAIFRGIGMNLSYQEKMGLFEKKLGIMHFLKNGIRKGFMFKYATPRPLSFASDRDTAKAFGDVIVTTVLTRKMRYIRLTQAFWEAANQIEASTWFKEVILLEVDKEVEYYVLET